MKIDLFTLIAQILNFLILVALLWHFLFRRIIRAMKEREKKIATRWEDAEDKKKEAQQQAEAYHRKEQELEEHRNEMINQAREEAESARKEWLEKARLQVDESKKRWHQALQNQQDSFLKGLSLQTGQKVIAISRRALTDLAALPLERRIIGVFLERIRGAGNDAQKGISEFINQSPGPMLIRTGFDISPEDEKRIRKFFQHYYSNHKDLRFERDPDLICGIELRANGHKLGWSISEYINELENAIASELEQEITRGKKNNETEHEPKQQ